MTLSALGKGRKKARSIRIVLRKSVFNGRITTITARTWSSWIASFSNIM